MRTTKASGFSLVEVACVVSIVGLLAAMLLTRTNTTRNNAQNAVFARLLKDTPTIRQRMIFGDPPAYTPPLGPTQLCTYEATSLTNVVVEMITSSTLEVRNLPSWMATKGISSFCFDGQAYTVNGTNFIDDAAVKSAFQW